jgi:UDP-arabinose 4-epimerase
MKKVFVTGGAGYVGSHCCKAFSQAGWEVVVFDNLARGWRDAVKWGTLIEGDVADAKAVAAALQQAKPDLVAHFAAYAYVGESVSRPDLYYRNNTLGTLTLLEQMLAMGVSNLVFSSTCATYGVPSRLPIDESHRQAPINPYGWSKLFVEQVLRDFHDAFRLNSVSLRYFNAAGCDPDGEIGERHLPETHVIPVAIEAAVKGEPFTVNGSDFETPDGTAVRDYIHVCDLARAHVMAAKMILRGGGVHAFNLGTGTGTSILEIVAAVERAVGRPPPLRFGPRRPGDPPALVASSIKARGELGWTAELSGIETIVDTALAWSRGHGAAQASVKRDSASTA